MRIVLLFSVVAPLATALCCPADEPAAQIIRNPYYFDSASVGDRYGPAPAAALPTAAATATPTVAAESVAQDVVTRPTAIPSSRSAERMRALSTAFGRTKSPSARSEPRRFIPPTDAKPLPVAERENRMRSDVAVAPATLLLETNGDTGTSPTPAALTSAVAAQLAVTRLTANPLRHIESTSAASSANPLR